MYLEHFGLREYPFTLTPDTSYFLASNHYQAALNTLLVAIHTGEGFIKITGEVGTGKTLLCRQFLACIEQINTTQTSAQYVTAYIPNPYLSPHGLMLSLAEELGISLAPDAEQHHVLKTITQTLLTFASQNQQVILCFDEAQAMPLETLEALRLLTNMETEKRKLLQIVLFGQPELDLKLQQNQIRQLNQRITFHYQLGTLKRAEVDHYVMHRLQIAGYQGRPIFTRLAIKALHRASGGIPRLINILAHKALMASFGTGESIIHARQIVKAASDTESAYKSAYYWPYIAILLIVVAIGLAWVTLK
ncbi:MAG: ExeA family protein [Sulfuriferula sp.]